MSQIVRANKTALMYFLFDSIVIYFSAIFTAPALYGLMQMSTYTYYQATGSTEPTSRVWSVLIQNPQSDTTVNCYLK